MKVWTFDDPRSFGARSIVRGTLRGMEEYGWSVRAPSLDPRSGGKALRQDLIQFSPDLLFFVNQPPDLYLSQMGFSLSEIRGMNAKRLVWVLDDPFLLGEDTFHPEDTILVADPAFKQTVEKRGGRRVSFLPVAADIDHEGQVQDRFSAPVAYVGSVKNMEEWRLKIPAEIDAYLARVICEKVRFPSKPVEEIMDAMPLASGRAVHLDGPLAYYLYVMANNRYRIGLLECLVPFGLQLFGNRDWMVLLEGSRLLGRYRGTLDPVGETPDLYRSASISVNLRSLQGFTAPTQRDFNVPAAGGFLLSSDIGVKPEDACEPYWQGIRSPAFSGRREIVERVRQFLAAPKRRREWTESAQHVIRERHRYVHRVEQMAEYLSSPRWCST